MFEYFLLFIFALLYATSSTTYYYCRVTCLTGSRWKSGWKVRHLAEARLFHPIGLAAMTSPPTYAVENINATSMDFLFFCLKSYVYCSSSVYRYFVACISNVISKWIRAGILPRLIAPVAFYFMCRPNPKNKFKQNPGMISQISIFFFFLFYCLYIPGNQFAFFIFLFRWRVAKQKENDISDEIGQGRPAGWSYSRSILYLCAHVE